MPIPLAAFLRSALQGAARRHRRVLLASGLTLGISLIVLGLVGFIRWRGHQALRTDTRANISQSAEQLLKTLQSRRGTLTFVRDILNHRSDLSQPQLAAVGVSGVRHTRHLLGIGLASPGQMAWWAGPEALSHTERARLNRAIANRQQVRGVWRSPSTFNVEIGPKRTLLIMLEPLRAQIHGNRALVGVFDARPMLGYFFASTLPPKQPVRVLEHDAVLYQSPAWHAPRQGEPDPLVVEHPVVMDAARWTLQMQPGATSVVQTLSWFNWLLIGLSALAGLGLSIIVWILAARTWLLRRAVDRRTAALRRVTHRLRELAVTDELTGLYNRRFFLDRWTWECERAKRYRRPLVCLMIDVNDFKQVNDQLGHPAGDDILKQVARELKTVLRTSDVLARFGGDEFIVALPETDPSQAEAVMQKLQQVRIPVPGDRGLPPVTLSVGMSRIHGDRETAQQVLEAADQSLYASKQRVKPSHRRW